MQLNHARGAPDYFTKFVKRQISESIGLSIQGETIDVVRFVPQGLTSLRTLFHSSPYLEFRRQNRALFTYKVCDDRGCCITAADDWA